MSTPSDINSIVKTAGQSIDYGPTDKAVSDGQASYIQSNLTLLGHKSGESLAGFTSLAKEVDYDHELIMGTTPVIFTKDPGVDIPGLMVKPGQVSVTGMLVAYQADFDAVAGCNPDYNSSTALKTLDEVLLANAGITQTEVSNNHRIVCTGSPTGVINALNTLNGMTGPYKTDAEGGDTSRMTKITITDTHRKAVANAVSSLTD